MTDNEKRAHDVAVVALNILSRKQDVDIFVDYINIYQELLSKFQSEFPTEHG